MKSEYFEVTLIEVNKYIPDEESVVPSERFLIWSRSRAVRVTAGDAVSRVGDRLPLLTVRPVVTFPTAAQQRSLDGTKLLRLMSVNDVLEVIVV